MAKTRVVVWDKDGYARYYCNPESQIYNGKEHLINPSFNEVNGIPTHYWKKDGNKLVAMQDEEYAVRQREVLTREVSPFSTPLKEPAPVIAPEIVVVKSPWPKRIIWISIGVGICLAKYISTF